LDDGDSSDSKEKGDATKEEDGRENEDYLVTLEVSLPHVVGEGIQETKGGTPSK